VDDEIFRSRVGNAKQTASKASGKPSSGRREARGKWCRTGRGSDVAPSAPVPPRSVKRERGVQIILRQSHPITTPSPPYLFPSPFHSENTSYHRRVAVKRPAARRRQGMETTRHNPDYGKIAWTSVSSGRAEYRPAQYGRGRRRRAIRWCRPPQRLRLDSERDVDRTQWPARKAGRVRRVVTWCRQTLSTTGREGSRQNCIETPRKGRRSRDRAGRTNRLMPVGSVAAGRMPRRRTRKATHREVNVAIQAIGPHRRRVEQRSGRIRAAGVRLVDARLSSPCR